MNTTAPTFQPIYADIWQHDIDDWDYVNPMECYRFKGGFVQLSKDGYWFPFRGRELQFPEFGRVMNVVEVNLVKPHVLV